MPNRNWRGNAVGASDIFVKEMGAALPAILSVLLRLAMLYLYFWYLIDFMIELYNGHKLFIIPVVLGALLALGLLVWKLVNAGSTFDLDKAPPARSLFHFVLLDLIPIAAVAVATWYEHSFSWGLLQFTQHSLKRIAGA